MQNSSFLLHSFFRSSLQKRLKEDWKKRATSSRICSRPCPRRTAGSPCPTGQTTWWLKLPWYEPDSSYRHIVPMVVMSVVSLMLYFLTVRSSMLSNDTNIIVIITMNNKDHHHNWLALSDRFTEIFFFPGMKSMKELPLVTDPERTCPERYVW